MGRVFYFKILLFLECESCLRLHLSFKVNRHHIAKEGLT